MAGISKAEREELAAVKSKFEHVDLNGKADIADALRKSFAKVAVEVYRAVPNGRNKSLAITHLEDASMRAIRALAHDAEDAMPPAEPADPVAESMAPSDEVTVEQAEAASAPKRRGPRKRTPTKEVVTA